MKVYISDIEKLNTTKYKIKQTLKQYDLSKVDEIEFVVKDMQGIFAADKIEGIYQMLVDTVIEFYRTEKFFNGNKTYSKIITPRVSLNLKNIMKQIEC